MGIHELALEYSSGFVVHDFGLGNGEEGAPYVAYLEVSFPLRFIAEYLSISGGSVDSLVSNPGESDRFWKSIGLCRILVKHLKNGSVVLEDVLGSLEKGGVSMGLVDDSGGVVRVKISENHK